MEPIRLWYQGPLSNEPSRWRAWRANDDDEEYLALPRAEMEALLERDRERKGVIDSALCARALAAEARVREVEWALTFYADKERYRDGKFVNGTIFHASVYKDDGERARLALSKSNEKGTT